MSTLLLEFDIVFPAGSNGRIVYHVREPRPVSAISLSLWVQTRSTQHGVVISLVDSDLKPVWSLTDFRQVTMTER